MAEKVGQFQELVDKARGELVIAIGKGTFAHEFWRVMDRARQYGADRTIEIQEERKHREASKK
jgi:hypothetical protein